jgi:hypothetical protein
MSGAGPLILQLRFSSSEFQVDPAPLSPDGSRVLLNPLSFAPRCRTVLRADKGKPIERWGRKATGLTTHVYDSGVAA